MDYFGMDLPDVQINRIPVLSLAHVGDAVYELMVRTYLVSRNTGNAHMMHRETVKRVSAGAQAEAAEKLLEHLTEEETEIFRRGRNAKVNSVPQAATTAQYHEATALEVLFGYLYLKGRTDRLNELFGIMTGEE